MWDMLQAVIHVIVVAALSFIGVEYEPPGERRERTVAAMSDWAMASSARLIKLETARVGARLVPAALDGRVRVRLTPPSAPAAPRLVEASCSSAALVAAPSAKAPATAI